MIPPQVYKACTDWVRWDMEGRAQYLHALLNAVHIYALPPKFLKNQLLSCPILSKVDRSAASAHFTSPFLSASSSHPGQRLQGLPVKNLPGYDLEEAATCPQPWNSADLCGRRVLPTFYSSDFTHIIISYYSHSFTFIIIIGRHLRE